MRGWIRSGLVIALWLGAPCSSFSRARDRPRSHGSRTDKTVHCPPPLRSQDHPLGLRNLLEADGRKAREGNELAQFSISFLTDCRLQLVPATLENPHASRLWDLPSAAAAGATQRQAPLLGLLSGRYAVEKKGTGFLSVNIDMMYAVRWCTGRGDCSRSRPDGAPRRHQPLRGAQPSSGRFYSIVAEPFPRKLLMFPYAYWIHNQSSLILSRWHKDACADYSKHHNRNGIQLSG